MGSLGKSDVIVSIFDEYGLGEGIVSFYKQEISEAKTDFLFIVPRKCLTEYKALVDEGNIESAFSVRRRDGVQCSETRYGTPKSFIFYIDDIKKKLDANESFTITVIDDIIVYGRGICLFLDKFLSYFSKEDAYKVHKRIRVVAFVRNAEIPFLQKKYPDIFGDTLMFKTYRTYSEPSDLKRISDLFLNSFAATMTPNTSFVNTWIIKADRGEGKLYHWLKEKISKKEENIYRDYVSHLNKYEISVFKCQKIEHFRNIVEFSCIRCYTSNLPRITLTPCVFLKPLKGEEIDAVYNGLLNSPYEMLVSKFWNKIIFLESKDAYTLKLEYLIRVISEIYGCHFLKEFQEVQRDIKWSDHIEEDTDALKFSYLDTYYNINDLFNAFEQYENKLNNEKTVNNQETAVSAENSRIYFEHEADSMRLFKESCFYREDSDEISFIDDYFAFNSDYDDKRAIDEEERLKGITSGYLKKELEEKKLEEKKPVDDLGFYGHLSCCMESGKAALTVTCVDDYYISVLKSGEQAYRLLTQENQWAIKYLSKIEEIFINQCLQDFTAEYMRKYIHALYEEKCIDDDDRKKLDYLIARVEDSRKKYFDKLDYGQNNLKHRLRRRIHMRDYYVERTEETPVSAYEERLKKVYDSVMAYS